MGLKTYYEEKLQSDMEDAGLHEIVARTYHAFIYVKNPVSKLMWPRFRSANVSGVYAEFRVTNRSVDRFFPGFFESSGEGPGLEDAIEETRNDDVFWDIGANIGQYSCLVGQRAKWTYSFEANARTASQLEHNRLINDIDGEVLPVAVQASPGMVNFGSRSPLVGELGRVKKGAGSTPAVSGDFVVESGMAPSPDVVKVDVTGLELEVLEGMKRTLDDVRVIYIEVHPGALDSRGKSGRDVTASLMDAGFEVSTIDIQRDANIHMLKGVRS